jgi:subtilisin family serine protease
MLPVVQKLKSRGILVVCAVGNEGPETSRSPGNYAEVLSVGACDEKNRVADFSSSQVLTYPKTRIVPDLVAPGVDILSCIPGGGFSKLTGTSMATPIIAGLAALLFQAKPSASGQEITDAIMESCELAPGMSPERAGRGVPNGPRALAILLQKTGREREAEKQPRGQPPLGVEVPATATQPVPPQRSGLSGQSVPVKKAAAAKKSAGHSKSPRAKKPLNRKK